MLYMIMNMFSSKFDGIVIDGMVGERFLIVVSCAVLLLCGVYTLVMASREDKRRKNEK